MDDLLDPDATPCSLCARLRRGVLYRVATEVGATKIALGHHADDFIETLLINLFFAGALKAMPAKLSPTTARTSSSARSCTSARKTRASTQRSRGCRSSGCCCPVCGDLGLQRQRIKRMLFEMEREHRGVKASLLKALGNVMPRHLLDRRLNPLAEVADAARRGEVALQADEAWGGPSGLHESDAPSRAEALPHVSGCVAALQGCTRVTRPAGLSPAPRERDVLRRFRAARE